jgi:hypothetical protein
MKKMDHYLGQFEVNLGKHENHNWKPVIGEFGPHKGKIICETCEGKWVTWLPKAAIDYLNK